MVDHIEHLAAIEVHQRHQALDGMRVAVLTVRAADEGQWAVQASSRCILVGEVRSRPGIDHDMLEVGDSPLAHGLLPAVVPLEQALGVEEVLFRQRGLRLRDVLERNHAPLGQRHNDLVGPSLRRVTNDHERPPVDLCAVHVAENLVLGRLVEADADEASRGKGRVAIAQDRRGGLEFVGTQRVQRVHRHAFLGGDRSHFLLSCSGVRLRSLVRSW